MLELQHQLKLPARRDDKARMNFVSGLRSHVLHELADGLRTVWQHEVEPGLRRRRRPVRNGRDVHAALRANEFFRFYSAVRVTAQDMVYQSVRPIIERGAESLEATDAQLERARPLGSLTLDPSLEVPRSVSAIDIHLMPGSYHTEYAPVGAARGDLTAGAIYDNRLAISSFGLMGQNLDDIGQSVARWLRERQPQFRPRRILDLGCTVGHNTGAWKDQYPEAEVHGIDVAVPCLRYALARARSQGRALQLHQMNAERLAFADASFDVVFSSMFLHEVPRAGIARVLAEAHRVLRPGGLMLHMELPPNARLQPFDAFYLDWDGDYNNEPFYKPFRALEPREAVRAAGFAPERYLEIVVPSLAGLGEARWLAALEAGASVDSARTGRLAAGVNWYCFGAWR
jgi:ubiquinone/menaquinone biosynthesis C-methylase UbiE